ncbi:MAG TPA: hypothetical protein VE035_17655 [Puia sp.]|nr:hypothetical protein [Puia sp.]
MEKILKFRGKLFDQEVMLTYDERLDHVKPCEIELKKLAEARKKLLEMEIRPEPEESQTENPENNTTP